MWGVPHIVGGGNGGLVNDVVAAGFRDGAKESRGRRPDPLLTRHGHVPCLPACSDQNTETTT